MKTFFLMLQLDYYKQLFSSSYKCAALVWILICVQFKV